jgi:hypothetical protein
MEFGENSLRQRSANRGWFRHADPRINRRGRPRKIEELTRQVKKGMPIGGRLKRVFVPEQDLCRLLCKWKARTFSQVLDPQFVHIVDAEVIPERRGVMLTLTSVHFENIEPGQPIPLLVPAWQM